VMSALHDLTFYLSTATQTDTSVTGGNLSTIYNTSVTEQVEVTYDYIMTSSAPEPGTLALFGGALVGIGLLRKRIKG
jgi:PEP-CTERM motif